MYISNFTFQIIWNVQVLLKNLKLIEFKKMQEFMSYVTTRALNQSISLPANFISNSLQHLKSI